MPERVDWRIFALFLEVKRIVRGLTPYRLAREAHVPPGVVWRVLAGRPLDEAAFLKLCAWQREDPEIFARRESP